MPGIGGSSPTKEIGGNLDPYASSPSAHKYKVLSEASIDSDSFNRKHASIRSNQ